MPIALTAASAGPDQLVAPPVTLDPTLDPLAPARRELRRQIAVLERQLSAIESTPLPGERPLPHRRSRAGAAPSLPPFGALERERDRLVMACAVGRSSAAQAAAGHADVVRRLEQMVADPRRHKFARIRNRDMGLGGCTTYTVRPRLGLLGMLAGWWEIRMSSGCP